MFLLNVVITNPKIYNFSLGSTCGKPVRSLIFQIFPSFQIECEVVVKTKYSLVYFLILLHL